MAIAKKQTKSDHWRQSWKRNPELLSPFPASYSLERVASKKLGPTTKINKLLAKELLGICGGSIKFNVIHQE